MRRVVVLNQFALPRTEGGGTRHIDLFSRLKGWETLIVAGNRNHYTQERFSSSDPRFRLLAVPAQSGGSLPRILGWLVFGARALAVTMRNTRVDLVYGSSPQPFAALAGLIAARLRRVPFVLEVRDLWPESMVSAGRLRRNSITYRVLARLERLLVTEAARIVCVTDGWEDHFADLGVAGDRLVLVPNGTEPSDFQVSLSRSELRRVHGVRGFTAVFAGAHGPKDGIDAILDAAKQLPQIHFLLVGSGSSKSDAVLRVEREGLENVEFRTPVPKVELPGLLRACDVGVHAVSPLSVFDKGMSPNKLFDYMAAGLPIVSNAATALARVVRDRECGRVGSSNQLAACLEAVHDASDPQREAWGSAAARILVERFSRAAAAEVLSEVLDSVVEDKSLERVPR